MTMTATRSGFSETSGPMRRYDVLDRHCSSAASLFNAAVAALILHQEGVSRVIASQGLEARFRSQAWDFDAVAYERAAQKVVTDSATSRSVDAALHFLGLPANGFFMRTPVSVAEKWTVALVICDPNPGKKPTRGQLTLLERVKAMLVAEFEVYAPFLTDPAAHVTAVQNLADARRMLWEENVAASLLDQSLTLVDLNEKMQALTGMKPGARLADAVHIPMIAAVRDLCQRALETRLSPPDFEIVIGGGGRPLRAFQLTISPFSPFETQDDFLYLTAREVTEQNRRSRALLKRIGLMEKNRAPPEPTLAFLRDSLVQRRSIRARRSVHYLTLRTWRAPIRDWQIKALRALKANIPIGMAEAIAEEICQEVGALSGLSAFRAIVPVPCSHSPSGSCLSVEIARALGLATGPPVIHALAAVPMTGSSHPKENSRRKPFTLAQPLAEPLLLIDDVATSGRHLEEALTLLRQSSGTALAVAWISGDTS